MSKIGYTRVAVLLMAVAALAAQEAPPGSRPLEPPLRIPPLTPLPNLATPPRQDAPSERQAPPASPQERAHRKHDEHPGPRNSARIYVVPYWGPAYAPPPPALYGPPAPPQPTAYWFYCPDPAGYYPFVQQCLAGWVPVVPPTGPAGG